MTKIYTATITEEGRRKADEQTRENIKGGALYDNSDTYEQLERRAEENASRGDMEASVTVENLGQFETSHGRPGYVSLEMADFTITEEIDE